MSDERKQIVMKKQNVNFFTTPKNIGLADMFYDLKNMRKRVVYKDRLVEYF